MDSIPDKEGDESVIRSVTPPDRLTIVANFAALHFFGCFCSLILSSVFIAWGLGVTKPAGTSSHASFVLFLVHLGQLLYAVLLAASTRVGCREMGIRSPVVVMLRWANIASAVIAFASWLSYV